MKQITLRLPDDVYDKLDYWGERLGMGTSVMARMLIMQEIKPWEERPEPEPAAASAGTSSKGSRNPNTSSKKRKKGR